MFWEVELFAIILDIFLQEKSLKFHARMFKASSAHVTKEIYTCLGKLSTSW